MATGSRTLWKGAITFGLVHIPVGLHTASIEQGIEELSVKLKKKVGGCWYLWSVLMGREMDITK